MRAIRRRHIEHMDLAVARDLGAVAAEDDSRVVHALAALRLFEDRAGMDENFMLRGQSLHGAVGGTIGQLLRRREFGRPIAAHEVETFGQADPVRPLLCDRLLDQPRRGREYWPPCR